MLDTTLQSSFTPGTNVKGNVAGANWVYLLSSMEWDRMLYLGAPSVSALRMLSDATRHLVICCDTAAQVESVCRLVARSSTPNVRVIHLRPETDALSDESEFDLIVLGSRKTVQSHLTSAEKRQQLRRLLKPTGMLYFEFFGPLRFLLGDENAQRFRQEFPAAQRFWLTPMHGEMHTAVPFDDRATMQYFVERSIYSPSLRQEFFSKLARPRQVKQRPEQNELRSAAAPQASSAGTRLHRWTGHWYFRLRRWGNRLLEVSKRLESHFHRHRCFLRAAGRCGMLVSSSSVPLVSSPPQYLVQLAGAHGYDIRQWRWGLVASGQYSSRKLLFFLFSPNSRKPDLIVKMTRDAVFNARLEREAQALVQLNQLRFCEPGTVPQVAFTGQHCGLAIVAETVIDGVALDQQRDTSASCRYARAAIDWLIRLGRATANPAAASPNEVAGALDQLLHRFVELYPIPAEHRAFLEAQIETIDHSPHKLPLVFQHGDPGRWNLLVVPDGKVAFLDWEAAEPKGIPLWDLFYFLRSHCMGVLKARHVPNRLEEFVLSMRQTNELSQLLCEATRRYCEQLDLPAHLVKPLFYTCWMHRALKEATRLPPEGLSNGHYYNLLRMCIENHDAPAMRSLFLSPHPDLDELAAIYGG